MDINNIKELIKLVSDSNLREFELEKDSIKIKMSKGEAVSSTAVREVYVSEPTRAQEAAPMVETAVEKVVEEKVEEVVVDETNIEYVNSPIVGTFYSSPSPDDPAFIKVGDRVTKGQTLCIIEAMKLMNDITAEVSGEVVEILVANEDMVQYDQPIIKIRRN